MHITGLRPHVLMRYLGITAANTVLAHTCSRSKAFSAMMACHGMGITMLHNLPINRALVSMHRCLL